MTATYGYDVFGALRSGGGSNYWLFTGEQKDADSGLYYLRARYYDPAVGRFLGRDPLPFINRYGYVGNNPTNFTDPSGQCPPTLCVPAGGGCAVGGPGGCVVGVAVGVAATGALVCIAGACQALADFLGGIGGIIDDIGDVIFDPFKSGPSRTERLEQKYGENLGRVAGVIQKIMDDPCNRYNRRHQEAKLKGFLRNLNDIGKKLGKDPVTYDPSSIPCLGTPWPDVGGTFPGDHGNPKE